MDTSGGGPPHIAGGCPPREDIVSIDFLITSLIVVVSPGTGVLYTMAAGLSRGGRAG
jgi:hypothetical protein